MTREQEIRNEVIFELYGSKELPITSTFIRRHLKQAGFDFSDQEVRDALYFLTGQGFAERLQDKATGEVRHRITSAGMLEYEGRKHE